MYEIYLNNNLIDFYNNESQAIKRVEELLKYYKGQIKVKKNKKTLDF